MTRNPLISLGVCLLATGPALAAISVECRFETECYETESCDASALTFDLSAGDQPDEVVLRSPGETVTGRVGGTDVTALTWSAETESASHLLSWGADGAARYSVHLLLGPEVVTYHGICEVAG